MNTHISVLLDEAIDALKINPSGCYLDATYGRGGHSKRILSRLQGGKLIVMDKDPEAIADANKLKLTNSNMLVIHADFASLADWLIANDIKLNGALFDLGVSSTQLDTPTRGFSFSQDAQLDMRMNNSVGETAAEWLNRVSQNELAKVIRSYGEERFAKRIAGAICKQRPVHTTYQLASIIASAQPNRDRHKHPATRTFQAIRIYINNELEAITNALESLKKVMLSGARLVVISFHSLEDRLVKKFFAANSGTLHPPYIPSQEWKTPPVLRIVARAFASKSEQQQNPRARSAVMRVAEFV